MALLSLILLFHTRSENGQRRTLRVQRSPKDRLYGSCPSLWGVLTFAELALASSAA